MEPTTLVSDTEAVSGFVFASVVAPASQPAAGTATVTHRESKPETTEKRDDKPQTLKTKTMSSTSPAPLSVPIPAESNSDTVINSTMKYVLITGGVVSGLGKGISSSSIGVLLKACGLNVTSIKIDPYLVCPVFSCVLTCV